jgi:hypothetical protein
LYDYNIFLKIENINNLKILSKNYNKKQNYFILSNEFISHLIVNKKTSDLILPMLVEPKNYNKKDFIGGHYSLVNILFSRNENLKYKISDKRLDLVNNIQKQSFSINKSYLQYLLKLPLNKLTEYTNLDFNYYLKLYPKFDKIRQMKKIQGLFLIYEFFLSIYIAELFQDYDI